MIDWDQSQSQEPVKFFLEVTAKEAIGSTFGGIGISAEWPDMQRAPRSSCFQYTSTIFPLGFSSVSVPGIPTNVAPKGTCVNITMEQDKYKRDEKNISI